MTLPSSQDRVGEGLRDGDVPEGDLDRSVKLLAASRFRDDHRARGEAIGANAADGDQHFQAETDRARGGAAW